LRRLSNLAAVIVAVASVVFAIVVVVLEVPRFPGWDSWRRDMGQAALAIVLIGAVVIAFCTAVWACRMGRVSAALRRPWRTCKPRWSWPSLWWMRWLLVIPWLGGVVVMMKRLEHAEGVEVLLLMYFFGATAMFLLFQTEAAKEREMWHIERLTRRAERAEFRLWNLVGLTSDERQPSSEEAREAKIDAAIEAAEEIRLKEFIQEFQQWEKEFEEDEEREREERRAYRRLSREPPSSPPP